MLGDDILSKFGQIPGLDIKSIKLGNGVVGKATNALIALIALMAVIAYRSNPDMQIYILGTAVFVFLIFFIAVMIFAVKHPNIAVLEGAELIAWRQMDMAASDPNVIGGLINTSPNQLGDRK